MVRNSAEEGQALCCPFSSEVKTNPLPQCPPLLPKPCDPGPRPVSPAQQVEVCASGFHPGSYTSKPTYPASLLSLFLLSFAFETLICTQSVPGSGSDSVRPGGRLRL